MKKIIILLPLTLLFIKLTAQDASVKALKNTASTATQTDTTKKPNAQGWTKGLNFSLSLTQVGNSNWVAAGGDKFSLSTAAALNAYASRKWGKNTWDNILDVNYGLVKTTTLGTRKINDRIDFTSKYGYAPAHWKNLRLSLLGQIRSQRTSGYE